MFESFKQRGYKIYIHLEKYSDPKKFEKFGSSLITSYNFFQAAIHLFYDGLLSFDALESVARDLIENYYFTSKRIMWSVGDAAARNLIPHKILSEVCQILEGKLNIKFNISSIVSQWPEAMVATIKNTLQVPQILKDPVKKYLQD
ncbi:MAG: hypothetical protein HYS98_05780 [Deltaproteobacteria bacterium]|nr:hypothetical protein [Deltaproteobacteria bacterium]